MVRALAPDIRPYRADDEAGVLTLLDRSLGDGRAFARDSTFWQWKHFRNTFGTSLLMVAVDREVLGLRAFLRWHFRTDTRLLRAVRAVDTATHPEHRRAGLFSRLTSLTVEEARADGVDLIFNTPNRYSLPGYLKLGWTLVGRPQVLIQMRRPLRMLRPSWIPRDGGLPALGPTARPVDTLLRYEAAVERLLAEDDRHCRGRIRTARSATFLRWRYGEAPSLAYHAAWTGPAPAGAVAILRPNRRRGLREVIVCDLLLREDGEGEGIRLLRHVGATADADYLVAHAPAGSLHRRVLRRAGFIPLLRVGPTLTVRPLSPLAAAASPDVLSRWRLTLGDLEVF